MQQYRNTDYIRLSAALHAREARLLTHAMLARMLDAPTPEESWKTLSVCGFDALERCCAAMPARCRFRCAARWCRRSGRQRAETSARRS